MLDLEQTPSQLSGAPFTLEKLKPFCLKNMPNTSIKYGFKCWALNHSSAILFGPVVAVNTLREY
jgi:hypothetical protein